MNYYEHHLGDYLRDTVHLSMLEDAAYRRLLDAYYTREGALPVDARECCKLARAATKAERDAVRRVLEQFFQLEEDGYHQRRADAEIARFKDKQRKARASAAAGWSQRKAQSGGNANADANASAPGMRTHSEGNAPRARTSPQTPDTSTSEPIGSGGAGALPTDRDLVFANGVTLLTAAGVSDKNARSFLAAQCKAHGEAAVLTALDGCASERPIAPVAWLQASLKARAPARAVAKVDRLAEQNAEVVRRFEARRES